MATGPGGCGKLALMRSLIWMGILVAAGACGSVDKTDPDAAIDATGDTAVVEFDAPTTIDAPLVDAPLIDAPVPIDATPIDAFSCTPNQFQTCSGSAAVVCNATGTGTTMTDCGAPGCNATAGRCNMCVPNNTACIGNSVGTCGADGLPAGSETCALSCNPTPTAHCAYLEPRYLPDICDAPATVTDFTVSATTIDTNLDVLCTGGIVTQATGPAICVIRARTITVGPGNVAVTGPRALALVSDQTLRVTGTLDASANLAASGPGGGSQSVASGGSISTSGSGGGGGFTAGANAGSQTAAGGGRAGGAAYDPFLLAALTGGVRVPSNSVVLGAPSGGGGGGAVTLISCRGTVAVSGTIDAGGGGGPGGRGGITVGSAFGGTGGGGGGYVVIQGLGVSLTGNFFANGGSGGSGMTSASANGVDGADGSRSATTGAIGAPSAGAGSGGGGAGSFGTTTPGVGLAGSAAGGPGGGGGAAGRFQTYTPTGITPSGTPTAASPRIETNRTTPTR